MKKLCWLLCLLLTVTSFPSFAQKVNQCGFKIPPKQFTGSGNFASVYEAKNIVDGMLTTIKWQENFTLREAYGINNAYATIIQSKRYIIYDNDFLETLDSYTGTDWASISVLAHEMGHHYYNHVVSSSGSTPPKEIEADYFSGYLMSRMGATLQQSEAAMNQLGAEQASPTHPAKTDRLNSISKGWNYAKSMAPQQGDPLPTPSKFPDYPNPNPNPPSQGNPNSGSTEPPANSNDPATWIFLTHGNKEDIQVELSDDGRQFNKAVLQAGEPFVFKFEIYSYGWLRLNQPRGAKIYKLYHGRDYTIQYNRRQQRWLVVEVL